MLEISNEATEVPESEEQDDVDLVDGKAIFNSIMIWDHESQTHRSKDHFLRGIEEWVAFADKVHSTKTTAPPV